VNLKWHNYDARFKMCYSLKLRVSSIMKRKGGRKKIHQMFSQKDFWKYSTFSLMMPNMGHHVCVTDTTLWVFKFSAQYMRNTDNIDLCRNYLILKENPNSCGKIQCTKLPLDDTLLIILILSKDMCDKSKAWRTWSQRSSTPKKGLISGRCPGFNPSLFI
jgi:hypothetical protein